jgi:hypothetical protein
VERVKRFPAALAATTAVLLLTAGCGDDGSPGEEESSPTPSTPAATESVTTADAEPSEATSEPEDLASQLTESASPNPTRVDEIADILGCDLGDGEQAPDGETEYTCGEFLIVDWGTADVTEEEMWAHVDSWVDDERPSYIPADQFIIVYGTEEALEPHSDELLGRS